MTNNKYIVFILFLVATLAFFPLVNAYAAESIDTPTTADDSSGAGNNALSGVVNLTPHFDSVSGNKSKFYEYSDAVHGGGIFSDARLGYDSDNYWMRFTLSDIG